MNIIIISQALAVALLLSVICIYLAFAVRDIKLKRLFKREYIKLIHRKTARKLYPFVPKMDSRKYIGTRKFLASIGWKISVEGIYLCKWGIFVLVFFILTTIQNTNKAIELKDIVKDVNYNHNMIETLKAETPENIQLERQLYSLVDENLEKGDNIYKLENKQMYIEYIESLIVQKGLQTGENLKSIAQRIYGKVLKTRLIRSSVSPYIYMLLVSVLAYYLPDILGQIKRKLIEDKKNWEMLNCMIVFSIFGRMPPYSVLGILENMVIVTEVYRPLLEALMAGIKKGGKQEEAFDAALEAVDRDELYELLETMKLARETGLVNSVDSIEDAITNTVKWMEIENITRRHAKMLYAMSAVAVVMALGCIYFAYGLTVISNPANMLMK